MPRDNVLFSDGDLPATLESMRNKAIREAQTLNEHVFNLTAEDTLVEEICARYQLEPAYLHENRLTQVDPRETAVDVTGNFLYASRGDGRSVHAKGYHLQFYLPYEGDSALFNLRGASWSSYEPSARVDASNKRLVFEFDVLPTTDPDTLKRRLQENIESIRKTLVGHARLIERFHKDLPEAVRAEVRARRARLEQMRGFSLQIGVPLERDTRVPSHAPVAVKKRAEVALVRKVGVPGSSVPLRPEPCISEAAYEEVLGIIRHTGRSFEKTPQTYKGLGEEGLRDIILSHLNVAFPGKASAETFLQFGKTDICLMAEEQEAFVAECKVWHGEKGLIEALDQLFDYLTWRESKAALIFFNKSNAGFTQLQATFSAALQQHPLLLRSKPADAGEWRHVFRHPDDPLRELTVHSMLFNVFVPVRRANRKR